MYANIKPLLLGKKKQRFFAILASPEGEAVGGPARRLMRGKLAVIAHERVAEANSPLIRPCGATAPLLALRATSPVSGESVPKGEALELFYIVSGAFTLNIVKMLWMTPRTARQRAMRPCCTVPSASRMRQAL